jgi:tripeptidyl-peptidase I
MKARSVVGTLVLLACSCLRINAIADVAVASNDKPVRNTRRSSTHTFREESVWISTHPDFSEKGAAIPTHSHDVVFVVKQKNIDELKNLLHEVSDPKHKKYGKHMTSDEIAAFTSNPDSHKAILDYVKSIGAEIVSESRYEDYVTARAPVSLWEKTFDTTFQTYSHHPDSTGDRVLYESEKNAEFVRTKEYSIPSSLDEHVAFVMNTVQLPMVKAHAIRPQYIDASSPDFHLDVGILRGFITPAKIYQAYNVDSNVGSPLATQAVYATLNEHYSPDDLTLFQKYFDLPLQAVDTVNDPRAESQAFCRKFTLCAEGNLDLEYIMAVGRSPTKFGYSDSEMAYYLRDVFDSGAPPLVISISYGIEENYLRLTETAYFEFQAVRLGLMGVTILVATGDDGATSYYSRLNSANCAYSPSYPATCSYVTAVGATQVSDICLLMKLSVCFTSSESNLWIM